MLNTRLEVELNKQLNAELYSAYLYLSMSAYLASKNLSGFSNWMKVQFEEEQFHALKLYNYIIDRGGKVTLTAIEAPKTEWNDILDVFEDVLAHEEKVTGLINELVNVSMEEKDHATVSILQWFVTEQVEEEATVSDLLDQLKLVEGKGSGLFILDREAKQRVFTPPAE
ncbi:MAG: ferritin [Bacteroidales bacterium]|nr:ferritin [Bacteroidota bacterium]MBL6950147.1 ferritin [Bacteroidales bacterium]